MVKLVTHLGSGLTSPAHRHAFAASDSRSSGAMAAQRFARRNDLARRPRPFAAAKAAALGAFSVGVAALYTGVPAWSMPWRATHRRRVGALPFVEEVAPLGRRGSASLVALNIAKKAAVDGVAPLPTEPSEVFIRCVEGYDPQGPHEFHEGPPSTGYRNITEAIRPYHPNPEWMIFPEPGFGRDQKICSMYTLATGLYKEINKALREDNEDSIRRHMSFIHELREVLRFKVDTICTPEGRRCRPFIGNVERGLTVPVEQAEAIANLYQVGTEFTWPAFTSCQMQLEDGNGLWPFDGNVNFEIKCDIDPKKMNVDEVYAPVRISRFMQGSNEVLFPPQTKFRVVGEKEVQKVKENEESKDVYTKVLEVVELPTPYKS